MRKLKEKAVIGVPSVTPTEHKEQGNAHVVVTVLYMLLGLIVPQGMIYGALAPFGISLAAGVSGTGAVLVYIATLVGYLLPGGAALPLRYMAAVAVTGAVRWTCGVLPRISKRRGFAPLLAFASTLVSGLLMNGTGAWLTVLLTVAESLAAGGFAYFFCAAFGFMTQSGERRAMTMSEQTGVILLGATALMALMPFEWYYLSPGRVLAAVIVMLLARGGREQSGAVAGIVLGVAATLCATFLTYVTPLVVSFTVDSVIGDKTPELPAALSALFRGVFPLWAVCSGRGVSDCGRACLPHGNDGHGGCRVHL